MASSLTAPLSAEGAEIQDPSARPPAKSQARLLGIIGLVVLVVVAAAVGIFFATKGSGGSKPQCVIVNCNRTTAPDGDCSQAVCESCNAGYAVGQDAQGSYCGLDCTNKVAFCAKTKAASRNLTTCEQLGCEECAEGAEVHWDDQTLLPTDKCRFKCTEEQITNGCAPGSCTDKSACSKCVPGFVQQSAGLRGAAGNPCQKASSAVSMTFFMYRAQSDVTYPPANVDLASASGVMWYLHNEVMNVGCQPPPGDSSGKVQRHYGITRVIRYKVTVFNTLQVYGERKGQFGHFYTFDRGQCTNSDCQYWWTKYGYAVGCQPLPAAQHDNYPTGAWYSLPGQCPSLQYSDPHKSDCNGLLQPGGQCDQPNGNSTCTWYAEEVDSVYLDKFCDITNYQAFCDSGKREYDQPSDKGVGCSFWDDKNNATRNKERVLRFEQLFAEETPGLHSFAVPEPVCDGF